MGQREMSKRIGRKRNEQEKWNEQVKRAKEKRARELVEREMSNGNGSKSSVINLEEIKFRA